MQFINSSQKPAKKPWQKWLIAVVVLVFIAGLFFALLNNNDEEMPNAGEYFDPGSQETVSDPPGKTPEIYGTEGKTPVYLGFSKMLDVGVTDFQINAAKEAFIIFSKQNGGPINEVSIFINSIKQDPYNPNDNKARSVSFDVRVSRETTYNASLRLVSIRSAELLLEQSGKVVFRSGVISADEHGD